MCGIVVRIGWDAPVSELALREATLALRHRGPDGMRTWLSGDGLVGLGHTRLAIIDPAAEQPIASEDGQALIVANGEFYGFEEISRRLEQKGHRLRTRSDSEIALHLWEDDGAACVESLRGEFAFAIWDNHRRTLFAARDRFGIKPLFYAELKDGLWLASEAKALFAAGIAPMWDHEALFHALHACPLEDRTLFDGIRQVPAGHTLTVHEGVAHLEQYWDPGLRRRRGKALPPAECVEQVRTLVGEAVRLRLRADVPVGCLLSGGLDSSTVLAMAAAGSGAPIDAFTIAFDQPDYDEAAAAAETAEHVGAKHTIVRVSDREAADNFSRAVWQSEMVHYNAHGVARYLLSRAIQQTGVKSVMGGEGADELFLGYAFLRPAMSQKGLFARVERLLKLGPRLMRSPRKAYPHLAAVSPWLARLSTVLDPTPLTGRVDAGLGLLGSVLSRDILEAHRGQDIYRTIYSRCNARAGIWRWEPVRQMRYLWFHTIFPNYHMAADRLDMTHGVEVRLPYLDHVLFDYVDGLPTRLLTMGPQEKFLLREASRPFLPERVHRRVKQPFWAPPSATREGSQLHDMAQDTLRSHISSSSAFLDREGVTRLLDRLDTLGPTERSAADPLLMMLVSVCALDESMRVAAVKRSA